MRACSRPHRSRPWPVPACSALLLTACSFLFLAGTCRRPPPSLDRSRLGRECALFPDAVDRAREITVGLVEAVDPAHAPHPRNLSERFLFRQLYETLLRVDCAGQVYGGLAEAWSGGPGGREWTFTLREDARFWDGSPVTSAAVLSSWTGRGSQVELPFTSAKALSERVLRVTLRDPRTEVSDLVADPSLAVARPRTGSSWPMGTGPYRIAGVEEGASDQFRSLLVHAGSLDSLPTLRFEMAPGSDARDLLDRRVDLVVTSQSSVLDYAATLAEFSSHPLPWHRTLVLVSPGFFRETRFSGPGEREPASLAPGLLRALARDAVRGEARGSQGPYWWRQLEACALSVPTGRATEPQREPQGAGKRIVYLRGDRDARDLAERLVALVSSASTEADVVSLRELVAMPVKEPGLRAAGLSAEELGVALGRGAEAGYIIALPRRVPDPCGEAEALLAGAGWLDRGHYRGASLLSGEQGLSRALVPLVDTRSRVLAREAVPSAWIDGDGTLLFFGAPWHLRKGDGGGVP